MEKLLENKSETGERGFEKISPTAKFVAYERTYTNIPYSKEIAGLTDAKEVFEKMAGDGKDVEHTISMFEARFKSVSKILKEKGNKNILEIATGLSPRSLIMTEDPDVNYVATDLPGMLKEVEEIHRRVIKNKNETNIKFKKLDILNNGQLLDIISSFPDNGEPVAIIIEGLLMYLDREEQMKVAKNIHEALLKREGFWITTDFMIRGLLSDNEKARKKVLDKIGNTTGRTM